MSIFKKIFNYAMSTECIDNLEYYLSFPPEDTAKLYAIRAAVDADIAIHHSKITIKKINDYKKYVIRIANSAATDANLHSNFINDYLNRYFNLDNRKLLMDAVKNEIKDNTINKAIDISKDIKVYVTNLVQELDDLDIESMINKLYKELEEDWEIINK